MDPKVMVPLTVEIATIILLLVAIFALWSIIRMVDGRLLRGWRLMLLAFGIAVVAQVLTTLHTAGVMEHPYQVYVRFLFVLVGLTALWHMAKTFDDCRAQARRR